MKNSTIAPLSLILLLSTVLSACGQMMGPGQQGYMMNMPFGGLFMILVLVGIVIFISLVLKGVTGNGHKAETPLDILKRRYASGEIDKDEYERMKKVLRND